MIVPAVLLIMAVIVVVALIWDNRHYPHLWEDHDDEDDSDDSDGP